MKFLAPLAGVVSAYGILTTPAHGAATGAIKSGARWAGDNEAFTREFCELRFFGWLEKMRPYHDQCLFVSVPDAVGDAARTLQLFGRYGPRVRQMGFPVAYVAQDDCEHLDFPASFDALFVGGSTEWKLSQGAVSVIRKAQNRGKHIHIGRVNWWKRYSAFRVLAGSEDFTCDGTRTRFEGKERTLRAWRGYERQPPLLAI